MKKIILLSLLVIGCVPKVDNESFIPFKFDTTQYKSTVEVFEESLNQSKDLFNKKPQKQVKVLILDTMVNTDVSFGFLFKDSHKGEEYHGTQVSSILFQRLKNVFGSHISDYVEFHSCEVHNEKWSADQVYKAHLDCYKKALNENFDFVNISISGTDVISGEESLFKKMEEKGIIITTSAGNENIDASDVYPCKYKFKNIYCVGNITTSGQKNLSSNFGTTIKYWALGTDVVVIDKRGSRLVTGTSQSSPQVLAMLIVEKITQREDLVNIIKKNGLIFKSEETVKKVYIAENQK